MFQGPHNTGAFPVNTGMCPVRGTENTGDGARGYTSPYFFCAASIRAFLTFSGILSPHVSLANV